LGRADEPGPEKTVFNQDATYTVVERRFAKFLDWKAADVRQRVRVQQINRIGCEALPPHPKIVTAVRLGAVIWATSLVHLRDSLCPHRVTVLPKPGLESEAHGYDISAHDEEAAPRPP